MEKPTKRIRTISPTPYLELPGHFLQHFNSPSTLIVQLNNCVSRKLHPHSFIWDICMKFPYGDPYRRRLSGPYPNLAGPEFRSTPGSFQLLQPPTDGHQGPTFACLYGQYQMGKPDSRYYLNTRKVDRHYRDMCLRYDTYNHRLKYFNQALDKLFHKLLFLPDIEYVIIPKYLGCDTAGGQWDKYESLISNFCKRILRFRPNIKLWMIEK